MRFSSSYIVRASPAPVVECVTPAPALSCAPPAPVAFAAPAPVVEYTALAPAVSCASPAPSVCAAPAPEVKCRSPVPAVNWLHPRQRSQYAPTVQHAGPVRHPVGLRCAVLTCSISCFRRAVKNGSGQATSHIFPVHTDARVNIVCEVFTCALGGPHSVGKDPFRRVFQLLALHQQHHELEFWPDERIEKGHQ